MSTERIPDSADLRDARIDEVLREALDDCVFLVAATELGEGQAVRDLWQTRLSSRLRRDLPAPGDLIRAVEMLLVEPAYQLADELLWPMFEADPDDLLDGPWSL